MNYESIAVAGLVTFLLLRILSHLAPRFGLVAVPGGHRIHSFETPMIGGLAIFGGFIFGFLLLDIPLGGFRPILASGLIILFVGLLDDLHELSPLARFIAQIAASLLMIYWGHLQILSLGQLVSDQVLLLNRWSVPLTVFAAVGLINAFNMIDGIDGLCGSLAAITIGSLIIITGERLPHTSGLLSILVICVLVFLTLNYGKPFRDSGRVFLGDAGSMFLGHIIVWHIISISQAPVDDSGPYLKPVVALWLVLVPLTDTVTVMLRRVLLGNSPFTPDRTHLHHVLQDYGLNEFKTLVVCLVIAVIGAAVGLTGQFLDVAGYKLFWAFLVYFAAYFLTTSVILIRKAKRKRALSEQGPL